jgi:hypothetical protein
LHSNPATTTTTNERYHYNQNAATTDRQFHFDCICAPNPDETPPQNDNPLNLSSNSPYSDFGFPSTSFLFPPLGSIDPENVLPTGKRLPVLGHPGSLVTDVKAPSSLMISGNPQDVHTDLGIPESPGIPNLSFQILKMSLPHLGCLSPLCRRMSSLVIHYQ